jgi:L-lactate permease
MSKQAIKKTVMDSVQNIKKPLLALMGAMAFVELLTVGG